MRKIAQPNLRINHSDLLNESVDPDHKTGLNDSFRNLADPVCNSSQQVMN